MVVVLTDSHVHFDEFARDGRVSEVLTNARSAGVERIVAIGGNADANRLALSIASDNKGVLCSCGYDRDTVESEPDIHEWHQQLECGVVVAVGECGLDYYYSPESANAQKKLLELNLEMAREFKLPVIIHSRDADDDTLGLLREHVNASDTESAPGVLHCFTRTKKMARLLLDMGFYISFSGIVTFKNADPLREVAAYVPNDRLLLETDSPYLAPEPLRGGRNEPAFIVHVAARLAEVRETSVDVIAAITTRNTEKLF